MGRGRYWTEEHDRLLLMYKYLTKFTYLEIAEILRADYPWCSISNQDIRGRLRRKTQQKDQGARTISLQDWSFSKAMKTGADLHGQDAQDVAEFLDKTVDEADLNGMGRHVHEALRQTPEESLQVENIPFPAWMLDVPVDKAPSPLPQDEELEPLIPDWKCDNPIGEMLPPPWPVDKLKPLIDPESYTISQDPCLTDAASYSTYPDVLTQELPLSEATAYLTYPSDFLQDPPPPSQFATDPSLTPALIGTISQIQAVASGALNTRDFFMQTQGSNINRFGGNEYINGNTLSQASLIANDMIAMTIDQIDNLFRKNLSYEQIIDQAQCNILICVPLETVPDRYRVMVMTGVDPRFTVNRTPSPPRVQLPRHWGVGKGGS